MIRVANRLAQMNGWAEEQVTAVRTGASTSDPKIDVLTAPQSAVVLGGQMNTTISAQTHAQWRLPLTRSKSA
jgi:hypothetical protein